MGSSRLPKPRGRPPRVLSPGGAADIGGVLDQRHQAEQLVVRLVRIDPDATALTSVGDPVRVRKREGGYSVYSSGRRLDDVPPRFTTALRQGYRTGVVSELSTSPLRVAATLTR